ncbi:MAG: phosphohistidine phosphatase SixA, partial [Planctomycetes bacterium]|nr:phosphohistidine phosphatase SixA [Planctomycetota bacterium]
MRLYLVRHATAQPDHLDPRRPLSERGLQEAAKIAAFIRNKNIKIGALWHSTKLRAIQTAE